MYTLGVNPTAVITPVTNTANLDGGGVILAPGTLAANQDGNIYILLVAAGAIASTGLVGFWDENFAFTLISSSNDYGGAPLALNRGTPTASGQYFWAQVYGQGIVQCAAAAAADAVLATSGTAGKVDDVVATFFPIEGLTLMAAAGGEVSAAARISWPHTAAIVGA